MLKRASRSMRLGMRLEDYPQLVCLDDDDFKPAWDHIPQAPFRTQAWHETHAVWPAFLCTDSFGAAMDAACRTLGPGEGSAMTVLDEGFNVIFGYVCFASTLVECGRPAWYGCHAAFEWLERSGRFDRMDLAIWESTARRLGA